MMPEPQTQPQKLLPVAQLIASWVGASDLPPESQCARICDLAAVSRGEGSVEQAPEPESLGQAYETGMASNERSRQGSWFTPRPLAAWLTSTAFGLLDDDAPPVTLDPACGGGAFLLAAVREMVSRGVSPARAFSYLRGFDLDATALLVARAALEIEAIAQGLEPEVAELASLKEGNFLTMGPSEDGQLSFEVSDIAIEKVRMVLGNAPFQSQLKSRTAREGNDRAALEKAFGEAGQGYVDTATLFLLRALDHTSDESVISLIVPASVLASRDGSIARTRIAERASIVSFWRDGDERAFEGGVPVCSLFLRPAQIQGKISRTVGLAQDVMTDFSQTGDALRQGKWGRLLIDQTTLPNVESASTNGQLGDIAPVTADFRDQYYGLAELVEEGSADGEFAPLVVTGMIDPAELKWGIEAARFNREQWQRPAVKLDDLKRSELAEWSAKRLVPKVLVTTQSRIPEAFADAEGRLIPCPPLLVIADAKVSPWRIAALVNSPFAATWGILESAGSALSLDAVKLSASQLRDLPMPANTDAWERAAAEQQAAHEATDHDTRLIRLASSCRLMWKAYGLPAAEGDRATEWWLGRLPNRRGRN